jgi:formimidoylglutamate deiminase
MANPQIVNALFPDLLWNEDHFKLDHGILISEQGILAVKPASELQSELTQRRKKGEYVTSRRLPRRALIPGFINTHSHAFQRAIRGRTEYPSQAKGDTEDFWSWRSLMYQAASELGPLDIEAVSQAAFVEMVKSGITRVGEFHYLHHQPDGTPYPDPDELAHRVLSGAHSAGLSVTLLRAFYQRAGVGRPAAEGAQKIFCDPDVDFYLQTLDRLRSEGVDVGVTAHSVRAVPKKDLQQLVEYARKNDLPFHIHVSEQTKEIEECLEEYGLRPVELLDDIGGLGTSTTLVHAIHLQENEIQAIGKSRSTIASCPTTERNLGDGIVPAKQLLEAGASFTFGTDSQCQICLPEDARQLEYHLRLLHQTRSVLFRDNQEAAPKGMNMLTADGARSLGVPKGGKLETGYDADVVALDLEHLALAGTSPESLALDILFSFVPQMVTDVWCRGTEVVSQGFHRAEHQARDNLREVMRKLRRGEDTLPW